MSMAGGTLSIPRRGLESVKGWARTSVRANLLEGERYWVRLSAPSPVEEREPRLEQPPEQPPEQGPRSLHEAGLCGCRPSQSSGSG